MKRIYSFMFAAVAAFAAASCAQELDNQVPAGETVTFEASVDGAETKAVLDGKVSKWEKGDKITIHNGTKGFEFATTDEGVKANFSYTGDDFSGDKFIAVYPAGNYTADVEAKTVNEIVIPEKQVLVAGSYPNDAAYAVAYTESQSLEFKNAVALLKFKVKGDVKYGAFYADNGKGDLTGKYKVAYNHGEPVLASLEAKQWVDFHMNDVVLSEDATYYLAVAPATFATGFGISLNGVEIKKHIGAKTLKRNHIYDLGTLEYVAPADPSTLSWGICGDMTGWATDIAMTLDGDWFVANNVKVAEKQAFKLRADGSWTVNRGAGGEVKPFTLTAGTEIDVYHDGQDMTIAAGTYNFYLSKDCKKFKVEAVGGGSESPEIPENAVWGVCGTFTNNWDITKNIHMTAGADGWYTLTGVEIFKDDEFKFVTKDSWTNSLGAKEAVVAVSGNEYALAKDSQINLKVNTNGIFTISLNPTKNIFKVECTEEYTNLKVNITIDNKANWSPLSISLWDGDNSIVSNATVDGNKYAISASYIGSTLTCQLSSGSKTSEKMLISISKEGATVTLEETIIKLKVQLNTANAKQWWGETMKIHVWNTGTSFDTSWPGNTMTFEGNYTWSIIIPSELVGKTINYLVHNGNSWQSKDSKVTIKAEGNTVTGSSIGIN